MLPGDVVPDGEELDSNDGDSYGEESKRENAKQHPLLPLLQVQVLQRRKGKQEDGHVGDDVTTGIDVDLRRVRHALGLNGLVPEPLDGAADEQGDEDLGEAPGADDDDGDDVSNAHALQGEDAVVLEEEGHFGAAEAGVVEQECGPEGLPVGWD